MVPNGEDLGYAFGDYYPYNDTLTSVKAQSPVAYRSTASESAVNGSNHITPHPWGILFTILGTVLLDFDADACQSPARAYLLDVTVPGNLRLYLLYIGIHRDFNKVFIFPQRTMPGDYRRSPLWLGSADLWVTR